MSKSFPIDLSEKAYLTPIFMSESTLVFSKEVSCFGSTRQDSRPVPRIAVTMSIISVVLNVLIAKIAPAAAGAAKLTTDCMVALIPLYRMSCPAGTSWGITAFTAGVCIPAPKERTTDMASRPPSKAGSDEICGIASTIMNVANAISISAPMISFFLWYRSAHTPPINEMRNCGR